MPFETVPGLKGKVYVPETRVQSPKRYPCRDCYACQMCSDDRCNVCRRHQGCLCDQSSAGNPED
jgi:hypothetical protein